MSDKLGAHKPEEHGSGRGQALRKNRAKSGNDPAPRGTRLITRSLRTGAKAFALEN